MTPFSDLPFGVFDGKDGTQTHTHGPLSHIEHFSDISSYITGFGADIATLTQSGIILSRDSISFAALPDGSMRLFFYDLQNTTINDGSVNKDNLREGYSKLVVFMLDNIFDYQQLMRFEEQGYDFHERMNLSQRLQAIAKLNFSIARREVYDLIADDPIKAVSDRAEKEKRQLEDPDVAQCLRERINR